MKNFMLILMLVMATAMQWWIIPVAFGLWMAVKYVKRMPKLETMFKKDTTIYL